MGYVIHAIVGKSDAITKITSNWVVAKKVDLRQGYSLIQVSDELLDDINELVNSEKDAPYPEFLKLSSSLHELLQSESITKTFAYIESDYFGSVGAQSAVLYANGETVLGPLKTEIKWCSNLNQYYQNPQGQLAINSVLSQLGVSTRNSMDEFESLQLGSLR
ncbi:MULTISPECIES: hypothetical protein [Pseudoalteromonas]|uniref:Uncharacterized protein n=1 Tax=Pseudoalteromonas luteoviolacea (strain 2ta16) TaxID=1353533 RepID=V4J898_PSEL2|nr:MULTISPECIES: hypothetical protein [Pseudoalteromonas]ESP91467.1 hypothetical protein PL2TA16_00266 [Pseudoalteromonas luteoviolacea 2ta16]KZN40116.1 hypothetical protein N483_18175 [Pseudoalteromonas luteoviolacea NCIMB 1944]MCG7551195.1 hypothetical protein [Pseudoalteromonas sp. Of7M-16]